MEKIVNIVIYYFLIQITYAVLIKRQLNETSDNSTNAEQNKFFEQLNKEIAENNENSTVSSNLFQPINAETEKPIRVATFPPKLNDGNSQRETGRPVETSIHHEPIYSEPSISSGNNRRASTEQAYKIHPLQPNPPAYKVTPPNEENNYSYLRDYSQSNYNLEPLSGGNNRRDSTELAYRIHPLQPNRPVYKITPPKEDNGYAYNSNPISVDTNAYRTSPSREENVYATTKPKPRFDVSAFVRKAISEAEQQFKENSFTNENSNNGEVPVSDLIEKEFRSYFNSKTNMQFVNRNSDNPRSQSWSPNTSFFESI